VNDHPVTTTEIADLIHRIRLLAEDRQRRPSRAPEVLADNAELLARYADEHADQSTRHNTDQPTRSPTTPAPTPNRPPDHRREPSVPTETAGAKSEENPPRPGPPTWGQIRGELRGQSWLTEPRRNCFDQLIAVRLGAEAVHEGGQPGRATNGERAPTRRDDLEWVLAHHVGPPSGKGEQPAVLAPAVDPILHPVTPMNDELEVTTEQRMEPVDHPDTSVPTVLIRCS
jgi:hypothetical protein